VRKWSGTSRSGRTIRWLRANAKTYNLAPQRVAIMGDSSGGWTTAMAAVTGDRPELEGDVGPRGPSSAVQAAVPFYPPTDFLQMDAHMPDGCRVFNSAFGLTDCHSGARSPESLLLGCTITACPGKVVAANPLIYIGERHTPPFLIFHGEQDPFVPYHQSRLLYDALASAGEEARLISFPRAGHGPLEDMLTEDETRRGAYEETTRNGHSMPARPVTPTWPTSSPSWNSGCALCPAEALVLAAQRAYRRWAAKRTKALAAQYPR
jgi:acetyl esterase/lipase